MLVFGDFDADGITGLAILTLALRRLGVEVIPYVPSRLDEGHGLSLAAVEAARSAGATVIVTVDTGSSSVDRGRGGERGRDRRAHHGPPPGAAESCRPPRDRQPASPRRDLPGAARSPAAASPSRSRGSCSATLRSASPTSPRSGPWRISPPCSGRTGRSSQLGLELLRAGPRPGLAALLAVARVDPAEADLETIAFAVAPRLNAAGRVGEAFDAARLLLSEIPRRPWGWRRPSRRRTLTRKDMMRTAVAEARTSPDAVDDAAAVVVRGPWPVGIVGLVASRLAEERLRPAVVGADLGAVVRASCRSAGGFHLADALASCSDILLRHGGHAGAAGFEIETERWPEFRERFLAIAVAAGPPETVPSIAVDVALRAPRRRLRPPPGPAASRAVRDRQPGAARGDPRADRDPSPGEGDGGHSQLVLKRRLDVLDGIAFGWPELAGEVTEGMAVDIVAQLKSRRFGGIESLQLDIRDAAPSGYHPEARGDPRSAARRGRSRAGGGLRIVRLTRRPDIGPIIRAVTPT